MIWLHRQTFWIIFKQEIGEKCPSLQKLQLWKICEGGGLTTRQVNLFKVENQVLISLSSNGIILIKPLFVYSATILRCLWNRFIALEFPDVNWHEPGEWIGFCLYVLVLGGVGFQVPFGLQSPRTQKRPLNFPKIWFYCIWRCVSLFVQWLSTNYRMCHLQVFSVIVTWYALKQ